MGARSGLLRVHWNTGILSTFGQNIVALGLISGVVTVMCRSDPHDDSELCRVFAAAYLVPIAYLGGRLGCSACCITVAALHQSAFQGGRLGVPENLTLVPASADVGDCGGLGLGGRLGVP